MNLSDFELRQLDADDADAFFGIVSDADWDFTKQTCHCLLASGTVFAAFDSDGRMAATVAINTYDKSIAFIGAVITRKLSRGRGLATRLLDLAENRANQANVPTALISTPMGLPVYEGRGYKTQSSCVKFLRKHDPAVTLPVPSSGYQTQPLSTATLPEILQLDEELIGVDRSRVLNAMMNAGSTGVVLYDAEIRKAVGYACVSARASMKIIGPVIAENEQIATALCADICSKNQDDIRIDCLSHQTGFIELLENIGFKKEGEAPLMTKGGPSGLFVNPSAYGIISQAFG
ncbi:MAG: GNAT family N-acetyltransferase [Sneathiella sp.]